MTQQPVSRAAEAVMGVGFRAPPGKALVIDGRAHLPRPGGQPGKADPSQRKWFGRESNRFFDGGTLEDMVSEMDALAIDRAVLVTAPGRHPTEGRGVGPFGSTHGYTDEGFDELCTEIADAVAQYSQRFVGTAMLDPAGGFAAVRQAERAVTQFGFRGCAIMPALIGRPASDPMYYPVAAKCTELGVPLTINTGLPGPMRQGSIQAPHHIDTLALAFPELTIVATHVGHPWHIEVIRLLVEFDNVFLVTSAWAPKRMPRELIEFINGPGHGKVMWGSDYPLLAFERCIEEIDALGFGPAQRDAYVRYASLELYWPESPELHVEEVA